MRKRPKILIATTNNEKMEEIMFSFDTMPFEFLSLNNLDEDIQEPEEIGSTEEENALLKAKYYAEKTGYITMADDTGYYMHALNGWPGIHVGREYNKSEHPLEEWLDKMKEKEERSSYVRCAICVYDPQTSAHYTAIGELHGQVDKKIVIDGENNFGFNPIFVLNENKKSLANLNLQERAAITHRAKALKKVEYFLKNQYGSKELVLPVALIVKEGRILMNKRNDPHNKEAHGLWEFPGGGVDFGENIREALIREAKEESGCEIEVIKQLQHINTEEWTKQNGKIHYQLHVIPFVCKIVGGEPKPDDNEVLESQWFGIDNVLNQDLIGRNDNMYKNALPELKQTINEHNL